jgi:hypothetical protein
MTMELGAMDGRMTSIRAALLLTTIVSGCASARGEGVRDYAAGQSLSSRAAGKISEVFERVFRERGWI